MSEARSQHSRVLIDRNGLQALIAALVARGYQVVGPTLRDGAIVYDAIGSVADLPAGWVDRQDAGSYRLERRDDAALFGYAVGPHSWKRFLHPPIQELWRARRKQGRLEIRPADTSIKKYAFLGVRACELHAMQIQDRVFRDGVCLDAEYVRRRENAFLIAVNCAEAGGTCFCVSMRTGPKADSGFDIALTELIRSDSHEFLVDIGSTAGAEVLAEVPQRQASAGDIRDAEAVVRRTASHMGRRLETEGIKELLQDNPNHPRWAEVAERCLACTNCTMVCPTCFCTTVEDHSDLAGVSAERVRKWDSCFTMNFSYIHGGSVRRSGSSRYRQWMTHKLASWFDQFGTSGCVGCGRCITWCPVGIDITEEAAAIRASSQAGQAATDGSD